MLQDTTHSNTSAKSERKAVFKIEQSGMQFSSTVFKQRKGKYKKLLGDKGQEQLWHLTGTVKALRLHLHWRSGKWLQKKERFNTAEWKIVSETCCNAPDKRTITYFKKTSRNRKMLRTYNKKTINPKTLKSARYFSDKKPSQNHDSLLLYEYSTGLSEMTFFNQT